MTRNDANIYHEVWLLTDSLSSHCGESKLVGHVLIDITHQTKSEGFTRTMLRRHSNNPQFSL